MDIYLKENGKWKYFKNCQKKELDKRKIKIGYGASIGDGAKIGDVASIGDETCIGDCVFIGDDVIIGNGAIIGNRVKRKVKKIGHNMNEIKKEIMKKYKTDGQKGIIISPGKFYLCRLYVPYFVDCFEFRDMYNKRSNESVFFIKDYYIDDFPELKYTICVSIKKNKDGSYTEREFKFI